MLTYTVGVRLGGDHTGKGLAQVGAHANQNDGVFITSKTGENKKADDTGVARLWETSTPIYYCWKAIS